MIRVMGFALDFLSSHGKAADKFDEAFTVALRWDGGDLRFVMGKPFPNVFRFFDQTVLCQKSVADKHEKMDLHLPASDNR